MLKAQTTKSQAQKSGEDKEKVTEEEILTARTGAVHLMMHIPWRHFIFSIKKDVPAQQG